MRARARRVPRRGAVRARAERRLRGAERGAGGARSHRDWVRDRRGATCRRKLGPSLAVRGGRQGIEDAARVWAAQLYRSLVPRPRAAFPSLSRRPRRPSRRRDGAAAASLPGGHSSPVRSCSITSPICSRSLATIGFARPMYSNSFVGEPKKRRAVRVRDVRRDADVAARKELDARSCVDDRRELNHREAAPVDLPRPPAAARRRRRRSSGRRARARATRRDHAGSTLDPVPEPERADEAHRRRLGPAQPRRHSAGGRARSGASRSTSTPFGFTSMRSRRRPARRLVPEHVGDHDDQRSVVQVAALSAASVFADAGPAPSPSGARPRSRSR